MLRRGFGVGQSAHENDIVAFFDDEQERMTGVEVYGLDVGRNVVSGVQGDGGTCGQTQRAILLVIEKRSKRKKTIIERNERIIIIIIIHYRPRTDR